MPVLSQQTPESLVRIEAEVRLFSTLAEGDAVRWERAGCIAEGRIVEKCRYGAPGEEALRCCSNAVPAPTDRPEDSGAGG